MIRQQRKTKWEMNKTFIQAGLNVANFIFTLFDMILKQNTP
jgi:hypothetical protein